MLYQRRCMPCCIQPTKDFRVRCRLAATAPSPPSVMVHLPALTPSSQVWVAPHSCGIGFGIQVELGLDLFLSFPTDSCEIVLLGQPPWHQIVLHARCELACDLDSICAGAYRSSMQSTVPTWPVFPTLWLPLWYSHRVSHVNTLQLCEKRSDHLAGAGANIVGR